jgi:subtilisin family serine protease
MAVLDPRLRVLLSDVVAAADDFSEAVAKSRPRSVASTSADEGGTADEDADEDEGADEPSIDFLARCSTRTAKKNLETAGADIRGVVPGKSTVLVGRASLSIFGQLAEVRGVERIEMSRPMEPDLDLSRIDAQVEPLHIPTQVGVLPVRGEGAVVGVIDSGIDYRHPKFRNTDGSSRILFLWDQNAGSNVGRAVDLGDGVLVGREYTKADLDAALASANPFAAVPHRDMGIAHGTHVCGIAAGNGQNGLQFRGVAPDSDLIVVAARREEGTLGRSHSALLAYQYVIVRAGSQPVVINHSQGMNGGGHFGETVLETGIDNLLRDPGVVAVKSAGNEQQWQIHAGGTIAANGTVALEFDMPQQVTQPVFIELWVSDANVLGVAIEPPQSTALPEVVANVDVSSNAAPTGSGNQVVITVDRDMDGTGETQVFVAIRKGSASFVRPGRWQMHLRGVTVADGRYDVWIERAARSDPHRQARFRAASSENSRNISIPGTARRIITVGAYVTRSESTGMPTGGIADFSSRGPARLGAQKPEISAPGETIISARSIDSIEPASPDSDHTLMAGTSMAAPLVAGAVALILSEHPNLVADQVKQILMRSARVDSMSMSAPDSVWGAGKLDARAAYELAGTVVFPGVTSVTAAQARLTVRTDVNTTVTVGFSKSLRRLQLGTPDGTRTSLTLGRTHHLDFSDLSAGSYWCEVRVFSDQAYWTIDDNEGVGYRVTV